MLPFIRCLLMIARVNAVFTDQQRVSRFVSGPQGKALELSFRQPNMALGPTSPGKRESWGVYGWRTAAAPLNRKLYRKAVSDHETLTEGFIFTACRYLSNRAIKNLGIGGWENFSHLGKLSRGE